MKQTWIALLALAGLLLAGCQSAAEPEEVDNDVAGADWRTWGWVQDAGTVVHGGEETDVLVCVNTNSIDLYYDDDTQTLYDYAQYPISLEDAQSAYQGTSFDDQNGDGNSDLTATFVHDDGTETVFVWFWDADAGFVYWEDTLEDAEDDTADPEDDDSGEEVIEYAATDEDLAAIAPLVGYWAYDGADTWLRIYADATWQTADAAGERMSGGYLVADGDLLDLYALDVGLLGELQVREDGTLTQVDFDSTFTFTAEASVPEAVLDALE